MAEAKRDFSGIINIGFDQLLPGSEELMKSVWRKHGVTVIPARIGFISLELSAKTFTKIAQGKGYVLERWIGEVFVAHKEDEELTPVEGKLWFREIDGLGLCVSNTVFPRLMDTFVEGWRDRQS